jgi:hypothetical protein
MTPDDTGLSSVPAGMQDPHSLILRCEPRRCVSIVRRRASKDALGSCSQKSDHNRTARASGRGR